MDSPSGRKLLFLHGLEAHICNFVIDLNLIRLFRGNPNEQASDKGKAPHISFAKFIWEFGFVVFLQVF